jgi:hypothetical protein
MLGALTTLKNLLAKEQALLTLDTLTYVGLITDGRPEGRPWWDNRPEYGQGWTGVNVPLPGDPMDSAPDLAGVPIISSGLRNTSAGTPIKMPTAASSNPGNVSVCRGPGRWRQLKLECLLLRPVQQPKPSTTPAVPGTTRPPRRTSHFHPEVPCCGASAYLDAKAQSDR